MLVKIIHIELKCKNIEVQNRAGGFGESGLFSTLIVLCKLLLDKYSIQFTTDWKNIENYILISLT